MAKTTTFIPILTIDRSDRDAKSSFVAGKNRKGYVRLYNKNAMKTTYHKIVRAEFDRFGYIVEGEIPKYWQNVTEKIIGAKS